MTRQSRSNVRRARRKNKIAAGPAQPAYRRAVRRQPPVPPAVDADADVRRPFPCGAALHDGQLLVGIHALEQVGGPPLGRRPRLEEPARLGNAVLLADGDDLLRRRDGPNGHRGRLPPRDPGRRRRRQQGALPACTHHETGFLSWG